MRCLTFVLMCTLLCAPISPAGIHAIQQILDAENLDLEVQSGTFYFREDLPLTYIAIVQCKHRQHKKPFRVQLYIFSGTLKCIIVEKIALEFLSLPPNPGCQNFKHGTRTTLLELYCRSVSRFPTKEGILTTPNIKTVSVCNNEHNFKFHLTLLAPQGQHRVNKTRRTYNQPPFLP